VKDARGDIRLADLCDSDVARRHRAIKPEACGTTQTLTSV
jgi:hypothetical protein